MDIEITLAILGLFGAMYSYFIYPAILLLVPKNTRIQFNPDDEINPKPFLTIIVTAYNEEAIIKEKILNTLELDYPVNQREIFIVSDGSTDNTNNIVKEFESKGLRLIEVEDRKGKENAQLAAIKQAKGDILVFSDAATHIPKTALKRIAATFDNETIGALSSEDRVITESGKISGESAYIKYEMWLRNIETRANSLVGLSGSFFACRKNICENWDIDVPSDFNTALNCVEKGFTAVSHPGVLGCYSELKDDATEYQRKLRTTIRGITAIVHKPSVLNPFRYGLFSFQVFSHKIMRWLVPWFQLLLFITTALIWNKNIYTMTLFLGQLGFYSLALIGWTITASRKNPFIKIPFYFMQVNTAIAQASIQFLLGKRISMWEPSKR